MKGIKTRTLLQVMAMLVASVFILGCPIDDEDLFTGDVTVVNSTGGDLEFVSIHEDGAAVGTNLLTTPLLNTQSDNFSGYDCVTTYRVTVRVTDVGTDNPSASFIPPCGETETVEFVMVVP